MGFSTSAAAAIIFTGVILMVGVMANVVFDTYGELRDAALAVSDSEYDRQRTRLSIIDSDYNATTVFLNVSNTGEVTLSTQELDLLLNGSIASESILTRQVSGTSSQVWGVHEVLYLEVSYGGANNWTRIRLITGNGVSGSKVMV